MEKVHLQLYKAVDAEEAYAIRFAPDQTWLARTGFGSQLQQVWMLEVLSESRVDRCRVDWDAVLERAIEAYRLSDPVITNFNWPDLSPTR